MVPVAGKYTSVLLETVAVELTRAAVVVASAAAAAAAAVGIYAETQSGIMM